MAKRKQKPATALKPTEEQLELLTVTINKAAKEYIDGRPPIPIGYVRLIAALVDGSDRNGYTLREYRNCLQFARAMTVRRDVDWSKGDYSVEQARVWVQEDFPAWFERPRCWPGNLTTVLDQLIGEVWQTRDWFDPQTTASRSGFLVARFGLLTGAFPTYPELSSGRNIKAQMRQLAVLSVCGQHTTAS